MEEIHEPDVILSFQMHFINMRTNKTSLYLKIHWRRGNPTNLQSSTTLRHHLLDTKEEILTVTIISVNITSSTLHSASFLYVQ